MILSTTCNVICLACPNLQSHCCHKRANVKRYVDCSAINPTLTVKSNMADDTVVIRPGAWGGGGNFEKVLRQPLYYYKTMVSPSTVIKYLSSPLLL